MKIDTTITLEFSGKYKAKTNQEATELCIQDILDSGYTLEQLLRFELASK